MRSKAIIRVRIIFGVLALVALVLLFRLFDIQIVNGSSYSDRADRQYVRTTGNLYDRGSIFLADKDGRLVSGATLKTGYTIAINPSAIIHPEDAYNVLSSYVELDEEDFLGRIAKTEDPYEEVAHRVPPETAF